MSGQRSIFNRERLTPSQAREVGRRRLADAIALIRTGNTRHANAAMYLGGYSIECILKARLLEKHPEIQSPFRDDSAPQIALGRKLVLKGHDLQGLLAALPEVVRDIKSSRGNEASRVIAGLRWICATWTVFARYSPRNASLREAEHLVDTIKEVIPWLA
jgi:hypothetical protein